MTRRAWINFSEFDNVAEGRCHRTWQTLNPDDHPDAVAEIEHEFSSVVLVTVSHGSWSVREEPNRGLSLVYKTVVDPGGNVPPIAYNRAVSRMLPDNMMTFVNAAK